MLSRPDTIVGKRENADGTCDIIEGADKNKDQSYFLALLRQEQLQRALFPSVKLKNPKFGKLPGTSILRWPTRKTARGFASSERSTSTTSSVHVFLTSQGTSSITLAKSSGNIVVFTTIRSDNAKASEFPPIPTIKPMSSWPKISRTTASRLLFDEPEAPIYQKEAIVGPFSFVNQKVEGPAKLLAKPRYRDKSTPVGLIPLEDGRTQILFEETQRALAPGQVLALYDGESSWGSDLSGKRLSSM